VSSRAGTRFRNCLMASGLCPHRPSGFCFKASAKKIPASAQHRRGDPSLYLVSRENELLAYGSSHSASGSSHNRGVSLGLSHLGVRLSCCGISLTCLLGG
jgi:hypothetical protein